MERLDRLPAGLAGLASDRERLVRSPVVAPATESVPPDRPIVRTLMRFHADLHIHSKYSRATSRDLDLEHLAAWACRKGISVVGTGDFTHPAWAAELKAKLVPAGPGLFRLSDDAAREVARMVPAACHTPVQFMLSVEISTIYKKGDRTRKIHHLIYAPDFETMDRVTAALARIGNIASDGRPILGLDSRHLLEIALESGPGAYLIPAHIWTPWFAALGSQSGFDSITECYGDLSDHIFAVETGLSSDPAMNWRLSMLDRYRLVSNSDAHSPGKLGREATMFDTEPDYFAIRHALETGEGYVGTVEFFPEEGKYHLDGHRKCGIRWTPEETIAHGNRCPVCGQPTTVGVLHRVESLADRTEAEAAPPPTAGEVSSMVALPEVLSEIVGSGPGSQAVSRTYERLLATLGAELWILRAAPLEDISRSASSLLAEAIARLRAGQVICESGYDGEYGVIRVFEEAELKRLTAGGLLFGAPVAAARKVRTPVKTPKAAETASASLLGGATVQATVEVEPPAREAALRKRRAGTGIAAAPAGDGEPRHESEPVAVDIPASVLSRLDDDQRAAAEVVDGPLAIVAGPGSGKTRTLTHRLAHLVAERGVPASCCLAITFTRRAAAEMRDRLTALLPADAASMPIHTFHSLGLTILRDQPDAAGLQEGFRLAHETERTAMLAETLDLSASRAATLLRAISRAKRTPAGADDDTADAVDAYGEALARRNWIDFDDLVGLAVSALESEPDVARQYQERFRWISVDEFQDVDEQQYRLITLLAPPTTSRTSPTSSSVSSTGLPIAAGEPASGAHSSNLCVIGDPNQAIYGFRGADAFCFNRFARDFPTAPTIRLARNYRSTGTIVTASAQVIDAPTGTHADRPGAAGTDEGRAARVTEGASASADAPRPLAAIVREMHDRITLHAAPTEREEAAFVLQSIERMMGGHSLFALDSGRATGLSAGALGFSDFAVLYRTDAQSAALCDAFARSGIPFKKHSHDLLASQPAVRAILSDLGDGARAPAPADAAANDDALPLDLLCVDPAARVLAVELKAAADRVAQRPAAPDTVVLMLALQRLLAIADTCAGDRVRFNDAVALATETDFWDPRADRVSLLTLHAAKGLEFPVVFITGLEDGLLPLYWRELDDATAAEERRLFYVGMTRAKDWLLLSRALQRTLRGRTSTQTPSPFLDDIETELVKHQRAPQPRRAPEDRQLRLL